MKVLLCPLSQPGYLYPAISVGLELKARGDDVHLLGHAAACNTVTAAGITALPAEAFGAPRAFHVGRWFHDGVEQHHAILRAARAIGADALLTSVLCLGALSAAETLDLPVIVLGFAAHVWSYQRSSPDEHSIEGARAWRLSELTRCYAGVRERVGLGHRTASAADLALTGNGFLLRGDPSLEDPGSVLPAGMSHIGPCFWEPPADAAELDEITCRLDQVGKSVVYVHLGRVFGGTSLWPRLNSAFSDTKFQAVVERGRSADPQPAEAADILVVRKPWMSPLIERADLVLTSATSAPVLGALLGARALIVAPSGSEQPVLASACVRAGVAVRLPLEPARSAAAILDAWLDEPLRCRARDVGARLAGQPGASRAADVLHAVTGRLYA